MSQDSGDLGSLPSNFLEVFFLIVLFSVLFIIVLVLFV